MQSLPTHFASRKPLDVEGSERDIGNAPRRIRTVRYDVVTEDGARGLVVNARE
jgi:hypothetical protein